MEVTSCEFIRAKNSRKQEKQIAYGGDDNPLNYRNLPLKDLWKRFDETYNTVCSQADEEHPPFEKTKKELVDLSNFCEFLWIRLNMIPF